MNRISVFYEHMAEAMKQENITLDEVCAAVKRFGFDGVELDANRLKNEVGTILPALQKAGLSVNGIYNFFDFGSANGSPESDSTERKQGRKSRGGTGLEDRKKNDND